MRHRSSHILLIPALALLVGCSSHPLIEADPGLEMLTAVRPTATSALPDWVRRPGTYAGAKTGTEYFLGVGFPRETRVLAERDAAARASANIACAIGEIVAAKWQATQKGPFLPGRSVQKVVEELARDAIARSATGGGTRVELHLEPVDARTRHGRALRVRAYALYATSPAQLFGIARRVPAQLDREVQLEPDAARQAPLKALRSVIGSMTAKDFTF